MIKWLLIVTSVMSSPILVRDNGLYVGDPLKPWFDGLQSGRGLCCKDADGTTDPDWIGKKGADGQWHYQVRLKGQWVDVPDDAVITEPNLAGKTIIWTYELYGITYIRCFMPGPMS